MFNRIGSFVRRIFDDFGWRFSITLASVYIGLKGFTSQLVMTAMLPFFKNLGVSGERYQSFGVISLIPWSLKSSFGLFADVTPFLGWHKRSYIVMSSIIGALALFTLGTFPFTAATAALGAVLLIPVNANIAIVDLLTEGKYAEKMVSMPQTSSSLVSYVWGLSNIGAFLASVIVGPLADRINTQYLFLMAIPLAVQVVIPTALGWFPEKRLEPSRRKFRSDKLRKYPNLLKLALMMTVGPCIVALSAFFGPEAQSVICITVAFFLAIFGYLWLPDPLSKANVYIFLSNVLNVSLPGALDYFFTADESCLPGGPNFSLTYYITYVNIVASLTSFIGVILFEKYLSHSTFRFALWTSHALRIFASLFDMAIVKRWNISLGIPDKFFFITGDGIILNAIVMMELLPLVVLISKSCPPGMESTLFSLLVSYQNLGKDVSRAIGVGLEQYQNIQTVEPCNFDGLPGAILVGNILIPMLAFPMVFWLIPNAKMTDDIVHLINYPENNTGPEGDVEGRDETGLDVGDQSPLLGSSD